MSRVNPAPYGKDWEAFSRRIRFERAKGKCECTGECGSKSCANERHYAVTYGFLHAPDQCPRVHGRPIGREDGPVVILTTAHLCHDPSCRDETHVKAMCQRCHVNYDRHHHVRSAGRTRDARRGQVRFFDAVEDPHPHG